MKLTCKVCGKQFEGRYPRQCFCSGECRLEMAKIRSREYRDRNPEKAKAASRKWWNENRAVNRQPKEADEILSRRLDSLARCTPAPQKNITRARKHRKIPHDSIWATRYDEADRATKLSMLSGALSRLGIAHLSYGYLSIIWLRQEYYDLLQQVLDYTKEHNL